MKKSELKRKTALKPKGRPGKKTKKPGSNRGDLKAQAKLAKEQRYREVCALVDIRDQGRCQFPSCGSRWNVQHHHCKTRAQGGLDDLENLVTLCPEHHTLGNDSPHMSKFWRKWWEEWARMRYPEYWGVTGGLEGINYAD